MSDPTPTQNESLIYLLLEPIHYKELTETSGIEYFTILLNKEMDS